LGILIVTTFVPIEIFFCVYWPIQEMAKSISHLRNVVNAN
jgi:hypothetical protein